MLWKINLVERAKSNDFILQVVWECTDLRDGFIGRLTDTLGFEVEDAKVPFDQVTEDMIVEWVKKELGDHEVLRIEQSVQFMIDANITNNKAAGAPWNSLENENA
jgi:hypothetical protein